MLEEYIVKFQYKKPDGFYTTEKETVYVELNKNEEEKNSHNKAEEIIKAKNYSDLKIISVTYC